MEREFSLSIFWKLVKKFWYLLLVAIVVAGAIGTVYATVLSSDSYVVDASVAVIVDYNNPPQNASGVQEGDAALFTNLKSYDYSKVASTVFDSDFNAVMIAKLKEFGYQVKEGDSTKSFYEIKKNTTSYAISVTMADRKQALELGQLFVDTVATSLESQEVIDILNLNGYEGYVTYFKEAPMVNPEKSDSAMSWYMGLAIGVVAGVAIYLVLVLILYFYNPKFQSVEEFSNQFDIAILEGDSAKNGLVNAAIKVKLALSEIEGTKTVALNALSDAEGLEEGLKALGATVAVASVEQLASDLSALDGAVASLKEDKKDYDYVLIKATDDAIRKDYLLLADLTDGAVLTLNMDVNYKAIKANILELAELKNINLVGVVF